MQRPDCGNPHCKNPKGTALMLINGVMLCGRCILLLNEKSKNRMFEVLKDGS